MSILSQSRPKYNAKHRNTACVTETLRRLDCVGCGVWLARGDFNRAKEPQGKNCVRPAHELQQYPRSGRFQTQRFQTPAVSDDGLKASTSKSEHSCPRHVRSTRSELTGRSGAAGRVDRSAKIPELRERERRKYTGLSSKLK